MSIQAEKALHLIEPGAAGCGPCTMAAVGALAAGRGERIVVLGGRRAAESAMDAGCSVAANFPMPLGIPRLARATVRKAWQHGRETTVIAWSEGAATAASLLPTEISVIAHLSAVERHVPLLEPWRRRRVEVRPIGLDVVEALAERGWRLGPGLDPRSLAIPAATEGSRRNSLRREWGAGPDDLVIGCVADPPWAIDLPTVFGSCAVCTVAGRKVRLIAHPESGRCDLARRWSRRLDRQGARVATPLILDERLAAPWLVADGIDLLLALNREGASVHPGVSPMTFPWWFARGVPAVATETEGTAQMLRDGIDGRLVASAAGRNAAAVVLMRLCDHPDLLMASSDAVAAHWHVVGARQE